MKHFVVFMSEQANESIYALYLNYLHPIYWLDTGCGTGKTACRALQELDGMEIHFTLCDVSSEMIRIVAMGKLHAF